MATATNTIDVLDVTGKKSGSFELPAELFDVQTNVPLIHQVVVAQLAAARQGTHKTKTRGEVSGAGRKPFKQKGTGRARQGSIRAPQMTGGGVVHGPQPRDYSQRTPKKMIAAALLGSLSDRARGGRLHVVETFGSAEAPKTRAAVEMLAALCLTGHATAVSTSSQSWLKAPSPPPRLHSQHCAVFPTARTCWSSSSAPTMLLHCPCATSPVFTFCTQTS